MRYSTIDLECLVVLWAINKLHPYIHGSHFEIYIDHAALTNLMNELHLQGRLARWVLLLQEYDFEIPCRPGRLNQVEDALSRSTIQTPRIINLYQSFIEPLFLSLQSHTFFHHEPN